MRSLILTLSLSSALLATVDAEFVMPDLSKIGKVVVCSAGNGDELDSICEWVEPDTVKRMCREFTTSQVKEGTKFNLEPGPILVFVGRDGSSSIAIMHRLDGWASAYSVKLDGNKWTIDTALMESNEYRKYMNYDQSWDISYRVWMQLINPELYEKEKPNKSEQATTRKPSD